MGRKPTPAANAGIYADLHRKRRPAWRVCLFVFLILPTFALPFAQAESLLRWGSDPSKGTTSRAARKDAHNSIPFDKLDAAGREKIAAVLSDVSFFRRMPIRAVPCDPDLYLFLVEQPDVIVNIWEVLGVAQMTVQQIGPGKFHVVDSAGTRGTMEYLYKSHDLHVIYTEGAYDGPLFTKPANGRGLVILKTGYVLETDGRYYVTARMDAFMRVESLGAELLAKTFKPLVGKVADINFTQTVAFLGSLSKTSEVNPASMRHLARNLARVDPKVRAEFALLAERVARKATPPDARVAIPAGGRGLAGPAAVAKRPIGRRPH